MQKAVFAKVKKQSIALASLPLIFSQTTALIAQYLF